MRYERFGDCLQRILKQQHMSAQAAASLMGWRSKNSVLRMMAGETTYALNARFFARLKEAMQTTWPEACFSELEEALEIERLGYQNYMDYQTMNQLLRGEWAEGMSDLTALCEESDGRSVEKPLRALFGEIGAANWVELLICGCCQSNLCQLLAECFTRAGYEGRVSARHYVDVEDTVAVRNVMNVLPLVPMCWYNAYLVEEDACSREKRNLYRGGILLMLVHNGAGRTVCHKLIQYSPTHFLYIAQPPAWQEMVAVLDEDRERFAMLKPPQPLTDSLGDLVTYSDAWRAMEEDCAIYSLKPDVQINCMPCGILLPAVEEAVARIDLQTQGTTEALLARLYDIHDRRFHNMVEKRHPTYLVYSVSAMRQFMRTGVQTDQWFMQRPYTPQERVRVMEVLRAQARENPYFHIYFLRESFPTLPYELTLYEGKGLAVLGCYNSYDFEDDHTEGMMTHPGVMRRFQRYFVDELLKKHVLDAENSLALLDELICEGRENVEIGGGQTKHKFL